jgi:hypothetical protein
MIFLWQAIDYKLLKHRKWKLGSEFCPLCGEIEDVNHLLFFCPLAEFIWIFMKEALGWQDYPKSI